MPIRHAFGLYGTLGRLEAIPEVGSVYRGRSGTKPGPPVRRPVTISDAGRGRDPDQDSDIEGTLRSMAAILFKFLLVHRPVVR
jgi:hypothetical protein